MTQPGRPSSDGVADYQILLVAYRSRQLIETLFGALPVSVGIVVVDNSHDVDGLRALVESRADSLYLDGPGRGYAVGANLGIRHCAAPYVLLVNPDSSPTREHFDALVSDLRADPQLAGVSAVTALPDGRVEIGVGGWEPSVRRAFVHAVGLHVLLREHGLWARPIPNQPIRPDWLSGACMAIRRDVFEDLGGFDESYFVYSEDVEFGRKVRESGRRLALRTDLIVEHLGGGSGEARTWMAQQRAASFAQYVSRYNRPVRSWTIRGILAVGMAARVALCALRGRHKLAAEHRYYVRGLLVGAPTPP